MTKRSWAAAFAVPLVLALAASAGAQVPLGQPPAVVALDAFAEDGRTEVQIETTSSSISYISYSRDQLTYVIDIYGMGIGDLPEQLDVDSAELRSIQIAHIPDDDPASSLTRITLERAVRGPTMLRVEDTNLVAEIRRQSAPVVRPPASAAPALRPSGVLAPTIGQAPMLPARRLDDIVARTTGEGDLAIEIVGDGRLSYESFQLDNPPRLVLDFHGVTNRVGHAAIPIHHDAVRRIRVAQFQNDPQQVARVVVDLGAVQDYRVAEAGTGVTIQFGDGPFAEPAPLLVEETAQGAPPEAPSAIPSTTNLGSDFQPTVVGTYADEEGTLISLDLKDADIKDVLRYFSEISGLNIILDPGVAGNVTVRLIDVPWNKALDIILKAHGYGKTLDGNVLRIADVGKLTSEEQLAADLKKSQEEARPLVTITRQVSYGSSQDIATIVQSTALSSKGSIIIDQRTNTLVITEVDIPSYRARILDLIDTLDTPTPQVEIEARVVETSQTWTRSFGIQWGFNQQFSAETGSTTDLTFPNSGEIIGDIAEGESGFESLLPNGGWAVNLPGAGANAAIGFHLANITDTFQLDAALSALEDEGHARVLSAPRVTTQSNIKANIKSGQNIPVQTIANNTITVQYVAADLNLDVTPQVTAEGTIILEVTVRKSTPQLGTAVGLSQLPPIITQQAQTTLMVPDGGTAVIGGVFELNESDTQNRIPALHKIPVLGWLFKNQTDRRNNTELLIFITPKIKTLS